MTVATVYRYRDSSRNFHIGGAGGEKNVGKITSVENSRETGRVKNPGGCPVLPGNSQLLRNRM